MPAAFPSTPGMVFPAYHVFADLAEVLGATSSPLVSDQPLRVQGLALRLNGRLRVLVANLAASSQSVTIGPLPGPTVSARRLNDETARLAMVEPGRYRANGETLTVVDGEAVLALQPYETVCLDWKE